MALPGPVSLHKVREALSEIQTMHLGNNPQKDPVMWDLSLGLRGMADALERIENQNYEILLQLQKMQLAKR